MSPLAPSTPSTPLTPSTPSTSSTISSLTDSNPSTPFSLTNRTQSGRSDVSQQSDRSDESQQSGSSEYSFKSVAEYLTNTSVQRSQKESKQNIPSYQRPKSASSTNSQNSKTSQKSQSSLLLEETNNIFKKQIDIDYKYLQRIRDQHAGTSNKGLYTSLNDTHSKNNDGVELRRYLIHMKTVFHYGHFNKIDNYTKFLKLLVKDINDMLVKDNFINDTNIEYFIDFCLFLALLVLEKSWYTPSQTYIYRKPNQLLNIDRNQKYINMRYILSKKTTTTHSIYELNYTFLVFLFQTFCNDYIVSNDSFPIDNNNNEKALFKLLHDNSNKVEDMDKTTINLNGKTEKELLDKPLYHATINILKNPRESISLNDDLSSVFSGGSTTRKNTKKSIHKTKKRV